MRSCTRLVGTLLQYFLHAGVKPVCYGFAAFANRASGRVDLGGVGRKQVRGALGDWERATGTDSLGKQETTLAVADLMKQERPRWNARWQAVG